MKKQSTKRIITNTPAGETREGHVAGPINIMRTRINHVEGAVHTLEFITSSTRMIRANQSHSNPREYFNSKYTMPLNTLRAQDEQPLAEVIPIRAEVPEISVAAEDSQSLAKVISFRARIPAAAIPEPTAAKAVNANYFDFSKEIKIDPFQFAALQNVVAQPDSEQPVVAQAAPLTEQEQRVFEARNVVSIEALPMRKSQDDIRQAA